MMRIAYLLLFVTIFTSCKGRFGQKEAQNNHPYDYYVQVVGISDGDTFKGLTQDNVEIRFRIHGIDAPERGQAFSNKSKQCLSDLIYGKEVGIIVQTIDRYKRPVVLVYTLEGKDVSAEMLKAGMAWHYKRYSDSKEYAELENSAKMNRIGLWADNDPVAPWNYRKNKKKTTP